MIAAVACLLVPGQRLAAQTHELDEGSFRLLIAGREVGTESFWIRELVADEQIRAQGRITLDTARTRETIDTYMALSRDSLRLLAYRLDSNTDSINGRAAGNRFRVRLVSPAGEMLREYLIGESTFLTEAGVAHHYAFLARRIAEGSASVRLLLPRERRHVRAEVTAVPAVPLDVAGTTVTARRITITPEQGDERVVWVDAEGRVLRFEVPSRQFVAERTALPR